jgi:hypothetical protein
MWLSMSHSANKRRLSDVLEAPHESEITLDDLYSPAMSSALEIDEDRPSIKFPTDGVLYEAAMRHDAVRLDETDEAFP